MKAYVWGCAGLLMLASCAETTDGVPLRVDCGDTDVLISQAQADALVASFDESGPEVGAAVCRSFGTMDTSGFDSPRPVSIRTGSGGIINAEVQASQQ